MKAMHGRWWLLAVLPVLGLLSGCSIFGPFYLAAVMMGYDSRVEPLFKFPEDAKRIVVITSTGLDTQVEMGHLDQELNEVLSRKLFEGFGEGKNAAQVIKSSRVAKWQDEHPDWNTLEPAEMGQALKADYVIYLEVGKVSLYEDGPSRILYRGSAEVTISVVRVENEELAFGPETMSIQFPRDRPMPASSDIPPMKFRREFIRRMAERLSWIFLPHDKGDDVDRDPF